MIITKTVVVKWCPQNTKHYKALGYEYKYKGEFEVLIKHLTKSSNIRIDVQCDVCGKQSNIKYQDYQRNILKYDIYTCAKCSQIKNKKTSLEKYGVDNVAKTQHFKDTYKQQMNDKYGVDNYFQTQECKDKVIQTCNEKYGVNHHYQLQEYKEKYLLGENNPFWIDGRTYLSKDRKTTLKKKYGDNKSLKEINLLVNVVVITKVEILMHIIYSLMASMKNYDMMLTMV